MTYYTVIGKPVGNDDDNFFTCKAEGLDDAIAEFKVFVAVELFYNEVDPDDVEVTWVFKSETKPEPVLTPWD